MLSVPTISVIVPVFDSEHYIRHTVESILNQDADIAFELLLIDDGSTDGSGAICDEYAQSDSRVRVFHINNSGVSVARNVGIENSRGEWIMFVDSDDELLPSAFRVLMEGVFDDTILCMAGYEVYDQDNTLCFCVEERESHTISVKDCLMQMYQPLYYYYQGYLWDKLFKSEIIKCKKLRFDKDVFFNEDRLFVVNYLCSSTGSVYFTTTPVYKYYKRATGAMASLETDFNAKFITDFDAQVKMHNLVTDNFDDEDLTRAAKKGVLDSYINIQSMIKKYQVRDKETNRRLDRKLRETLGLDYYRRKVSGFYKRLKRCAKRLIKK